MSTILNVLQEEQGQSGTLNGQPGVTLPDIIALCLLEDLGHVDGDLY